MTQTVVVL